MRQGHRGPIHTMLERAAKDGSLRFHMPGHKGLIELPGSNCDLTELTETDTLFEPTGAVLQAQREAAVLWNAAQSFLLVNGSTAGLQAMVFWAAMQGRKLRLPRDCHASAISACALADVQPEWIAPDWNADEQLYQFSPKLMKESINSGKAALLLTYPDYYGRCVDLKDVSQFLADQDAALLVDAAHGSHFPFSPKLPADAGCYARLWVSGAHKTLPAPTQTAFLHVKEPQDSSEISRILRGLTTTSPSWLLLAGLDNARLIMDSERKTLDELVDNCLNCSDQINRIDGLRCWSNQDVLPMGFADHDPTRLVVDVRGLGLSGRQAEARLREFGLQAEMCDNCRVVMIASIMDTGERLHRLYQAFEALAKKGGFGSVPTHLPAPPKAGSAVMTIRRAWMSRTEEIPLGSAIGRVAAEPFGAYPPGVPYCMPGEEITKEAVETARETLGMGGSMFGVKDGKIQIVAG